MLADVQAHFGLGGPFHRVGNFETEHQRALVREVCAVVQTGRLVVVSGLVGSGKTHLLTRIEEELAGSNRIAVAKSLAIEAPHVADLADRGHVLRPDARRPQQDQDPQAI